MKKLSLLLVLFAGLAGPGLHAEEERVVDKAGRGIQKGAKAAASGIEKGADATAKGVNKGVEGMGRGFKKAGEWLDSKVGGRKGGPAPAPQNSP